jgi:hypothetical protein
MDSVRYRKLLDYASLLEKQGNKFESEGEEAEAISRYIKMVDVLLLLAEVAPDYPSWQKFTGKAESYQKRSRILISKASAKAAAPPSNAADPKREVTVTPAPQMIHSK